MKKRFLALCLVTLLALGIFSASGFAADKKVAVKLPNFPITLNGSKVDNWQRQYPLIIYKDITYFPMTYHDCRFLGLETNWDGKTGLKIAKTNVTAAFREDYKKTKNLARYTATIASFPIKANGKIIDNAQEEYPLLLFRDVTYFPLTWRFAVDEFGWDYSFDSKEGLSIGATNQKLEMISLLNYEGPSFMIVGDSIVYQGKKGVVYQTPIANPQNPQKIFQLPLSWFDDKYYTRASFYKENGEYFMMYHTGGAVMGTDHYYKITPLGQVEKVLGGYNYSTSKFFNGVQIIAQQAVPPFKNNLVIFDGRDSVNIGNPDYIYAWASLKNGEISASGDIYQVGEDLYLLAIDDTKAVDHSKIYRLNLNTNELTLISDIDTNGFVLEGNLIYFAKDNILYKTNINGGKPEILTENLLTQRIGSDSFKILNGQVYYINGNDQRLYRFGTNETLNKTGKVKMLLLQDQYIIVTFEEEPDNPYRLMVFDGQGKKVFQTSDVSTVVSIDKDLLAYSIDQSGKVYTIKLK